MAPTAPKAQSSGSSSSSSDKGPSDAEVRAADQARTGIVAGDDGDAVETRAVGGGTRVVNRRAQVDAEVKRAESRGIYRDPVSGARRTVGAGQPIPDGWTRIESASIADRSVENSREAHAAGELIGDSSGGPAK